MRDFLGIQIKGVAAPPQILVIDGDPYVTIIRHIPGLQGTLNVEVFLQAMPEVQPEQEALPTPDWSQLMPDPSNE